MKIRKFLAINEEGLFIEISDIDQLVSMKDSLVATIEGFPIFINEDGVRRIARSWQIVYGSLGVYVDYAFLRDSLHEFEIDKLQGRL